MTTELERALFSIAPERTRSLAAKQRDLPSTPTNQQIIDASRQVYSRYRPAVDAVTLGLIASVRDSSLSQPLAGLNGTNWSSRGLTRALVDPFLKSTDVQTALGVVRTTDLASFSVGAFTKSLPGGGPGVIGFDCDLAEGDALGLTLQLDMFGSIVHVDNTTNLQYGVWLREAGQLHDRVIGFYVNAVVQGLEVNLKILLDIGLNSYGFVASSGATVPVTSGIFAGSTARWDS